MTNLLRDCPTHLYENCQFAVIKCGSCAAGRGAPQGKVHYVPIDPTKEPIHSYRYEKPRRPPKDQKRSKASRGGRLNEKQTIKRINHGVARATAGSGAVHGDGDAVLRPSVSLELRMEMKKRGENVEHVSVRSSELNKGIAQGVNCWGITVKSGTYYVLSEKMFVELLAEAKRNGETIHKTETP